MIQGTFQMFDDSHCWKEFKTIGQASNGMYFAGSVELMIKEGSIVGIGASGSCTVRRPKSERNPMFFREVYFYYARDRVASYNYTRKKYPETFRVLNSLSEFRGNILK